MKFSLIFLAIVAVLFMGQAAFAGKPNKVCATATNGGVPGGWTKLTGKDIKTNAALQSDAEKTAATLMTGKYAGCTASKVVITKACSQVVAGTNYEYSANGKAKCAKKNMPFTFTHTFTEAL